MDREKAVRRMFRELSYRTRRYRLGEEALYLLAWKGTQVRVIFLDLQGFLPMIGAVQVRERFLSLLYHLRRRSEWEGIFKGRVVRFEWLSEPGMSKRDQRVLGLAGVEPLIPPGQEEDGN